jgi:hypothetical protein
MFARPALRAQAPASAPGLVITILEGEGALNDIRQRTAREPIVEVDDENHRPIAGAAVLFSLPESGPGGTFADGTHLFSTVTDHAGRAVAHGLRPNNVSGSYDIHVKANFNGSSAETTIHQKNVSGQSNASEHAAHAISLKTILIIVGVAAAGGAVAGVLATQGGSSTAITAGSPTVGAPTATVRLRIQIHRRNH